MLWLKDADSESRRSRDDRWPLGASARCAIAFGKAARSRGRGGRTLVLRALRSAVHLHLGFGSFGEYVERLFGYTRRSTQEKLRVAEALERLPVMSRALESGKLAWSAVRELTRIAVARTEQQWIEAAVGKTIRQMEQLVEGKSPGDDPSGSQPPSERRHVLRFEVAPETFALFREAMTALRRRTGSMLDDDSALLLMARDVLGGPHDAGRASYQVALNVCAGCGRSEQQAGGELVPVGAEVVEMARCDGQQLGYINAPAADENTGAGDDGARAHVGVKGRANGASTRAKQTVPPAVRRAVLRRDHERCQVTGCRNTTFLDLHHIELRSEGGQNDPENLVTVCTVHHRAAHRGELVISGNPTRVRYQHADGTEYGRAVVAQVVDAQTKVFSALRGLGFRESQVHVVLAELRLHSDLRGASTERLLREALQRLAPPTVRPMRR